MTKIFILTRFSLTTYWLFLLATIPVGVGKAKSTRNLAFLHGTLQLQHDRNNKMLEALKTAKKNKKKKDEAETDDGSGTQKVDSKSLVLAKPVGTTRSAKIEEVQQPTVGTLSPAKSSTLEKSKSQQ